jgi:hypothetical protein
MEPRAGSCKEVSRWRQDHPKLAETGEMMGWMRKAQKPIVIEASRVANAMDAFLVAEALKGVMNPSTFVSTDDAIDVEFREVPEVKELTIGS